ncbi:MAG: hypothetical protein ACYTG6_09250 [Planctomycetota bacterium]
MPLPVEGIRVMPLGGPSRSLLDMVLAQLSRRVSVPCRLVAAPAEFDLPVVPNRDQVDADALLQRIEELTPPGREVVMGLTTHDVGSPIFTFFFGRARQGGRAALVSTARLSPAFYGLAADPELSARRTAVEILHELGHLAGLSHCDDARCLMRFCASVEDLDNRGTTFCRDCSSGLPRAFDPVATP